MEIVTIVLRIVHIFSGVAWAGTAWALVLFLEPTARALGPDGGKFLGYMISVRRFHIYMSVVGGLTVLAGWILFFMRYGIAGLSLPTGVAFAIGGVLGLIALGIGGGITGPSSVRLVTLGGELAKAGKPPGPEQAAQMAALQARLRTAGLWTAILTALAVLMMATARYI